MTEYERDRDLLIARRFSLSVSDDPLLFELLVLERLDLLKLFSFDLDFFLCFLPLLCLELDLFSLFSPCFLFFDFR